MENFINTQTNINPAFASITEKTTLGELLSMLNLGEKPYGTPTPKNLRETAGDPIGRFRDPLGMGEGGTLYANGYAVWDNGSGRTVVWLPDCVNFTYYFVKPKESEIGIVPEKTTLPEGLMESQPWTMALALIGEHRIEQNSMNRTGSRTGTKDYDSDDYGDKVGDAEDAVEKAYRSDYTWGADRFGEDPLQVVLREERRREMLEAMTDKQREVYVLYYQEGYNQYEIAEMLGIERRTVGDRLDGAQKKVRRFYV